MKTKKVSTLNYAFAVGKIRALEKFLIKQEVFGRAIEAGLEEALRLFVESGLYSDELLRIKNSQQLESVLNSEFLKLKNLILSLILDEELKSMLDLDILKCVEKLRQKYLSEFLKDYFTYVIDMHNIKTFLRLYILKEPIEKLKRLITCSGFIKKEDLFKLYTENLTSFLHRLEFVHKDNTIIDYAYFLRDAIQRLERENSFVALEKSINDFLIGVLKQAKYISFGPEPLLAYYFAKVNEINLIRMIILAKLNDVSANLVKERLNAVYA